MIRWVFAVMLGMLAATAVMVGMEFVGAWLVPLPVGELRNEADLADIVATAPLGKLAVVLLGWLVAAFAGGWIAARLARIRRMGAALAVGVLIVAGVAFNAWVLPHPLWMILIGLAGPAPLAWLGGRMATRPSAPRA